MMRESFQDAEVYFYVQNILRDEAKRVKLSPALAKRATELCDARTELFRYYYGYLGLTGVVNYDDFFDDKLLLNNSEALYEVVDEVAKAVGK